jgi:two-component system NtrC family sensor kinase
MMTDAEGEIRVTGACEGGEYVVVVSDSGPGIDPGVRDRLFDAFVTTRAAGEGTGLGLAIARDVVHGHGGTIDVDDAELGGARFTIRLPLADAATADSDPD